ncbi:MAG: ribose-5-phosphate isomerase RpiA [Candidatus Micrarchaeia archaeon]
MDPSKLSAAEEALKLVRPGQTIGLGTGSTAEVFIELLGRKNSHQDMKLRCIATSIASEKQAQRLNLPLCGFSELESLDIAFDGADQVDSKLNLIKGLGGALVREKIVDYRAKKFVIMVGESKVVKKLSGVVPVEVIPLAEHAVARDLKELGAVKIETRMAGAEKFESDNSNHILHAHFGEIPDPKKLEDDINRIAGVVDNGIFSQNKPVVIVGNENGKARTLV